jgi:hypothetical protein
MVKPVYPLQLRCGGYNNKNLSSQCNLLAQIEQVQDKIFCHLTEPDKRLCPFYKKFIIKSTSHLSKSITYICDAIMKKSLKGAFKILSAMFSLADLEFIWT